MTKNKRDLHGERKRDLYGNYIKINFVWQIQVRFVDYTDYTSYFQELEVDQKSFLSFEGNKLRNPRGITVGDGWRYFQFKRCTV